MKQNIRLEGAWRIDCYVTYVWSVETVPDKDYCKMYQVEHVLAYLFEHINFLALPWSAFAIENLC
jgi:hypothetical protein